MPDSGIETESVRETDQSHSFHKCGSKLFLEASVPAEDEKVDTTPKFLSDRHGVGRLAVQADPSVSTTVKQFKKVYSTMKKPGGSQKTTPSTMMAFQSTTPTSAGQLVNKQGKTTPKTASLNQQMPRQSTPTSAGQLVNKQGKTTPKTASVNQQMLCQSTPTSADQLRTATNQSTPSWLNSIYQQQMNAMRRWRVSRQNKRPRHQKVLIIQ